MNDVLDLESYLNFDMSILIWSTVLTIIIIIIYLIIKIVISNYLRKKEQKELLNKIEALLDKNNDILIEKLTNKTNNNN